MANRRKKRRATFGDIMRTLLMLIALVVFLFSGYILYGYYKEYRAGTQEYDNLESSFAADGQESENLEDLEDDDALQSISGREVATVWENGREVTLPTMTNPIDFSELKSVNDDIVGWLRIRALDISYPVVQAQDNDYYLHRTFEGVENFAGCLFVNCYNQPDMTDQNTIIYGHNMKNGSMFGKLHNFQEEDVFSKSKYFWVFSENFIYQYRIFSAMTVNKVGTTYQTFWTNAEFEDIKTRAFENSVVDNSNVTLNYDDRIVTLSTCTGDDSTRFVVMGKLAQVYVAK